MIVKSLKKKSITTVCVTYGHNLVWLGYCWMRVILQQTDWDVDHSTQCGLLNYYMCNWGCMESQDLWFKGFTYSE